MKNAAKPKLELLARSGAKAGRPSDPPEPAGAPERGVYEDEITAPGETWYKIVLSSGKVGIIHLPDELVVDDMCERLWGLLDNKDPQSRPKLRA